MQGLDINSSGNFNDSDLRNDQANYVNYNPNNNINTRINNSNAEPPYVNTSQNNEPLPNPPSDSNQVAAWYDTDLWIEKKKEPHFSVIISHLFYLYSILLAIQKQYLVKYYLLL